MATVENASKVKLEHLLGIDGGYVLNYSNASFASFVRNSIGVDPYERHNAAMGFAPGQFGKTSFTGRVALL